MNRGLPPNKSRPGQGSEGADPICRSPTLLEELSRIRSAEPGPNPAAAPSQVPGRETDRETDGMRKSRECHAHEWPHKENSAFCLSTESWSSERRGRFLVSRSQDGGAGGAAADNRTQSKTAQWGKEGAKTTCSSRGRSPRESGGFMGVVMTSPGDTC